MHVVDLTQEQMATVERELDAFDAQHVQNMLPAVIKIGVVDDNGEVIAGLFASMGGYRIMYVSILFVDERYRRQKIGTQLMNDLEIKSRKLGARFIRLDTFDWQGYDFYKSLGYEEVGSYSDSQQRFSEHFFLKRLS